LVNSISEVGVQRGSGYAYIDTSTGEVYIAKKFSSDRLILVDLYVDSGVGAGLVLKPSILNLGSQAKYSDFSEWVIRKKYELSDSLNNFRINVMEDFFQDKPISMELENGKSAGRRGVLPDFSKTSVDGYGFIYDSLESSVYLCRRKTESYEVKINPLKLTNSTYVNQGFSLKNDNTSIPDDEYEFDYAGGLLSFTFPYGVGRYLRESLVNHTNSRLITLTDVSLNGFNAKYISIDSNKFSSVDSFSSNSLLVRDDLGQSQNSNLNIYDNLFKVGLRSIEFNPVYATNFRLLKYQSLDVAPVEIDVTAYTVVFNEGYIKLPNAAEPNVFYKAEYQVVENNVYKSVSEFLYSDIPYEVATPTLVPNIYEFNSEGLILRPNGVVQVYAEGSIVPSTDYVISENRVVFSKAYYDQEIAVKYQVINGPGGNVTFSLSYNDIYLNSPYFFSNQSSFTFPGNLTGNILPGSFAVFSDYSIFVVKSASYDSTSDATVITFNRPLDTTKSNLINFQSAFSPADLEDASYTLTVATRQTSTIVQGNASVYNNSIVVLDGDLYLLAACEYNAKSNTSKLTFYTNTYRNYKNVKVQFCKLPICVNHQIKLRKLPVNGTSFEVMVLGSQEGRVLTTNEYKLNGDLLTISPNIGESLILMSMEAVDKPSYTDVLVQAAYKVNPDDQNRMRGQKLLGTYTVYAPDTFYFRSYTPETYSGYIATLSSGGRIPGNGNPSYTFQLQSYYTADYVLMLLVKYFNDLCNLVESVRENLVGTLIGNGSYHFRFDGNLNNPKREDYKSVTNDIDDLLFWKLYRYRFFFIVKYRRLYKYMYEYGTQSRLFKTSKEVYLQAGSDTSAGQIIGNLGVSNIVSTSLITLAPARAVVKYRNDYNTFVVYNGDPNLEVPKLAPGMTAKFYGTDTSVGAIKIVSVAELDNSTGLSTVVVQGGDSISMSYNSGTILSDVSNTEYQTFSVNNESGEITSTGELKFGTTVLYPAVPADAFIKVSVVYNSTDTSIKDIPVLVGGAYKDDGSVELITPIMLNEKNVLAQENYLLNLSPKSRYSNGHLTDQNTIVTDLFGISIGSSLMFMSGPNAGLAFPIVSTLGAGIYTTSTNLVYDSGTFMLFNVGEDSYGGCYCPTKQSVRCPAGLTIGSRIKFMSGPNANVIRSVVGFNGVDYILDREFNNPDITPKILKRLPPEYNFISLKNSYNNIWLNQTRQAPNNVLPYGSNSASFVLLRELAASYGVLNRTATMNLTGDSANFIGSAFSVPENSYIYITSGNNQGVYWISSTTPTGFKIESSGPFKPFRDITVESIQILVMYSFFDKSNIEKVSDSWNSLYKYYVDTNNWLSNPMVSDLPSRRQQVADRIQKVYDLYENLKTNLESESSVYEVRKSWISLRADKTTGIMSKAVQESAILNKKLANLKTDILRSIVLTSLGGKT